MALAGYADQVDLKFIVILLSLSNIRITGLSHDAWFKMSNYRF